MNTTTFPTRSANLKPSPDTEADRLERLADHFLMLAKAASHPHLVAYAVTMNCRAAELLDRAAALRRAARK